MTKYFFLKAGLIFSLLVLLAITIELSLIRHSYYKSLAIDNKLTEISLLAPRGRILDRKGREIAVSVYQEDDNLWKRKYPYGQAMGLISGYVNQVNEDDLKERKCGLEFDHMDLIGRGGVEEKMDCSLRGKNGRRLIEVDALGRYVRELGREEPVSGQNLTLSLDAYWQEQAFQLLNGRKAVLLVSNPKTGEVLVMASSPSFDPNNFSFNKNDIAVNNYLRDDSNFPLLNRAIAGRYHPGSVFKPVLAVAGLESGVISGETTFEDTGFIRVGDYTYSNWLWLKERRTEGQVNVVKALQRSNDVFFYKLGEKLGVDQIKQWAVRFGYGLKTGIELPGELAGIVPDAQWKKETKGETWFLGNTYHLSIGQGDLSVTPLQINQMTNIIANDGIKCPMTILALPENEKRSRNEVLGIKKQTLTLVKEGMKRACQKGGTGWPLFGMKTEVACKTGTAEVGDGTNDTHAWMTAFAPADNP